MVTERGGSITVCLSGAAKLARRQRGEKNCDPLDRGRKLEHRAARFQRCKSVVGVFAAFFFLFYAIFTSTKRGASAAENLDSPRH